MRLTLTLMAITGASVVACAPMDAPAAGGGPVKSEPTTSSPSECKAETYQRWIGRNRSELPAKPAGETWRVTCTTCPVTMDFNPQRLNILFDQASGTIREIKCG